MNVALLTGGFSSEREISIITGNSIADALREEGYDVRVFDIKKPDISFLKVLWDKNVFDVVFIAIHGQFGEDGQLQRKLEQYGIPYTGSGSNSSMHAMNKFLSKLDFQINNVKTAEYLIYNNEAPEKIARKLGLPVVIKPISEGSSIGVHIAKNIDEIEAGLKGSQKFGRLILEKYISGREMNVAVLDGKTLPIVEVVPTEEFYNYKAKYNSNETEYKINPELPDAVVQRINYTAMQACRALGCTGFSRVDMILDKTNVPFVLEINTVPGMTPNSLFPKAASAAGMSFSELCVKITQMGVRKAEQLRKVA
ncbi:MAG: D-alanine--D-alanine ligase [Planctomycetes bacterium]|nr:D-alanine--D-alanine ligase [Planctomycetota bacterium]